MLKLTQKEPSWSYVPVFIIYFPIFLFLSFHKHVFMSDENLYHFFLVYISQALICRKHVMDESLHVAEACYYSLISL